MAVMSFLLLYALAMPFPQALAVKSNFISEVKRDTPKRIETPFHKTLYLKRKLPSEVTLGMLMDYLRVTKSNKCALCMECINKAIYFLSRLKTTEAPAKHMQSRDFILNDIIENYHQYKVIRDRRDTNDKEPAKAKKNQVSKSKNVTVTKYNLDGQVYAIKLREKNSTVPEEEQKQSCHVFSVKKYYPCESPKAELIFTNAKRKANKRSRKQTKNTLTTGKPQSQSHGSRDKVLAESFMTSIEELYN